ncbi:MAG: nicotinate phosphoribosyltransferase [Desulfobacteraceae bacterium]|nr:MAG: nicotinate phosphoribosyltransferase [Desulfobacteraceae bacterium]
MIKTLYRPSLALLTDLYQLTMANGYWKVGRAEDEAVFHLFFRRHPFDGGYTIACGLSYVIDFLKNLKFSRDDIQYLGQLTGNDGRPIFENGFLTYLENLEFTLDVNAIPEGTVVFPQQPLLRVKGPLLQAQLMETPFLNIINFQSLIATKAARICRAAKGGAVLEFGLRRAQGIDGGLAASRAAYIGGCAGTSNVLAGKLFDIPVRGTHAHSWIMAFDTEYDAFLAYAEVMPNNCVFLVDTYDTLTGVDNAVRIGKKLRKDGHEMAGIRLDSGDLAYLSIEARKRLDEAGFHNTAIIAGNDLDEHIISSLTHQDAAITAWGVGTRLVTAHNQPSLGCVYKLSAIRKKGGEWQYKVKKSEQPMKTTTPGILQVRRYVDPKGAVADMIYDIHMGIPEEVKIIDPLNPSRFKIIPEKMKHEDLLIPVFQEGRQTAAVPSIAHIRERTFGQLKLFDKSILRLVNPHEYPSGLAENLYLLKEDRIRKIRQFQTRVR